MTTVLDLDLGNSYLKWRCGPQGGRLAAVQLNAANLGAVWGALQPSRVRLASVAAEQGALEIATWVRERWGLVLEVAHTQACGGGVRNSYSDPTRMGVDRWLGMLAGFSRAQGACCVVDCGSAITIDYVGGDGQHLGGYILPGLRLMRVGLLGNTQRVKVEQELEADCSPGRSTDQAVQHGLQLMLAALAERVVNDCTRLLGPAAPLLITGGDGERFRAYAQCGEWLPDLVLDGLAIALPGEA